MTWLYFKIVIANTTPSVNTLYRLFFTHFFLMSIEGSNLASIYQQISDNNFASWMHLFYFFSPLMLKMILYLDYLLSTLTKVQRGVI